VIPTNYPFEWAKAKGTVNDYSTCGQIYDKQGRNRLIFSGWEEK